MVAIDGLWRKLILKAGLQRIAQEQESDLACPKCEAKLPITETTLFQEPNYKILDSAGYPEKNYHIFVLSVKSDSMLMNMNHPLPIKSFNILIP